MADRDIESIVDSYAAPHRAAGIPGGFATAEESVAARVDPLRVLVTGSREWPDLDAIRDGLQAVAREFGVHPALVTVVHGAAKGADSLAAAVAWDLGMVLERHPADWARHGRSAGPRRNAEMVALGADVCLAFPLGASPGTRGCMGLAAAAGIPVRNLGDPDPAGQPDLFEAAS